MLAYILLFIFFVASFLFLFALWKIRDQFEDGVDSRGQNNIDTKITEIRRRLKRIKREVPRNISIDLKKY